MPDNATSQTKSPEELELEKKLAIAKLRNSIAQESKGPDVTVLQGTITSDGTFIESRILARRTLIEAFGKLGKAIEAKSGIGQKGTAVDLLLYNAADIPCIELYAGLKRQLVLLDAHYARAIAEIEKLLDALVPVAASPAPGMRGASGPALNVLPAVGAIAAPGPVLAGYAAGAVLRTAIDLVSLFRVDTDYKNFDLPIDDTALAAELRKVIPSAWKLWYPAQFPVNTVANTGAETSELLDALTQVEGKNMQAASLSAKIAAKTTELTGAPAGYAAGAGGGADLKAQLKALADGLDAIKAIDTAFAQVEGLLASADSATKTTTMSLLLRTERLLAVMKKEGAYVVKLAAVSRGSNRVTKWLWSSAVIWHSAGTELNCLIFAPTGEIVFADTQLKYTPYMKAKDIKAP